MITEIFPTQDPQAIHRALGILEHSGLVAFPTDTVYGIGAQAFNEIAVESIYLVKGRPVGKAIPILIGDIEDLEEVCSAVPEIALRLATQFWPGPVTLVLPKNPKIPQAVSATRSVGVRIPDHPFTLSLLRKAGPLAVTSANQSGQANSSTAEEVFTQLGGRIPIILDGGRTPGGSPSTIVDCSEGQLNILRAGLVSMEEIVNAAREED